MRKTLLFAAALCLASSAMAQTSTGTALSAKSGDNTYTITSKSNLYWTYTADKDYVATITPIGEVDHPTVSIKGEGDDLTPITGVYTSDWSGKMYAFQKGKTYIFMIEEAVGEAGFSLGLEEATGLGEGLTEVSPATIKLGETQTFGNPTFTDRYNVYTTYTAKEDGQLRIQTAQNVSTAIVNGKTITAVLANSKRTFSIDTEAGTTYTINFTNVSVPFFTTTSEVVQVTPGSIDAPFALEEGASNKIPAAAGKYYFTYKAPHAGYLNLSSDATPEGGQVSVYMNKLNAESGNNARGRSEAGSYNVRTEITSTYYTYYIVVDKKTATSSEEILNCTMEDYQPGETLDTAIPVEITDATPTPSITMPGAKGTYYYSITVPANTNKFLVVESATDLSEGSSAYVNTGSGTWGATKMENGIIKRDVSKTYEQKYYLIVTSNESSPLTLKVSYADAEKGSLISNPKDAVAGSNSIDFDGTEYFTYTTTKAGKLAITASEGTTVEFTSTKSGSITDTYQKGNVFYTEAKANTTYIITVSDTKKDDSFSLAETEFEAGEVRSTAIEITDDTYTLGEATSNLWLKYKVAKDGIVDFSCDAPFDYSSFIGIAKNDIDAVVSMADSDGSYNKAYQGIITVEAGDELYIQVQMSDEVQGKKLTLVNREPEVGEAMSNPLVLEKGKTVDISKTSMLKSLWIKAQLTEAETTFVLTGEDFEVQLSPRLDTDKISYAGGSPTWNKVELSDGSNAYGFIAYSSATPESPKDYYIRVVRADSQAKLSYGDPTATGITNVEATAEKPVSIYTIDGKKVNQISGSGVYIIKANGNTKKVVVKK